MTFQRLAAALCLLIPAAALAHTLLATPLVVGAWIPTSPSGLGGKALLVGGLVAFFFGRQLLWRRFQPQALRALVRSDRANS